jgi:transforming growth factor-beta-induced protein
MYNGERKTKSHVSLEEKMKQKTLFVMLIVSMVVVLIAPTASAQDDSIVDIAVADGRFTTLVAAVTSAGLADALSGGEWTVFAPTDEAFAKLGLDASNVAGAFSKAELTDILLYHALAGSVSSDEAKASVGDITMANGELAGLKVFEGDLFVNDDSKVIIPDIAASNGVIHVVDTVILGPWPRDAAADADSGASSETPASGNTIVDIAVNDGSFDTLVAAVTSAGLADALSAGEWTVFAPTDEAFAKLGLDASNVAGAFSTEELTNILLYHALVGSVSSDEAKASVGDITMANGELAGLKVFEGDLFVNDDSKVIAADILASNGVIHVVDTVILGPWPRVDG